jgi:hypothetical protein
MGKRFTFRPRYIHTGQKTGPKISCDSPFNKGFLWVLYSTYHRVVSWDDLHIMYRLILYQWDLGTMDTVSLGSYWRRGPSICRVAGTGGSTGTWDLHDTTPTANTVYTSRTTCCIIWTHLELRSAKLQDMSWTSDHLVLKHVWRGNNCTVHMFPQSVSLTYFSVLSSKTSCIRCTCINQRIILSQFWNISSMHHTLLVNVCCVQNPLLRIITNK